jgi:1-acyl-sn-glycerol-3-phosphate acyltransferase
MPFGLNRVERVDARVPVLDLEVNMFDRDSQQQTARSPDRRLPSWRRHWPRVVLVAVAGPIARRLFRLHVEGDQHLPTSGPAIIAANHQSFFDHVALILSVGRPLSFVGKIDYLDSWKTRHLLPALGMIPVDRGNGRRALAALDQAAEVLQADELFAIYPEGTRSRDGSLHAGHTGVGQLSVATGASVVPAGIVGTNRIQPAGARIPRPFRRAVIRFGPPIDPARYRGTRRECRRRITSDVMRAIGELSGLAIDPDVAGLASLPQRTPHDHDGNTSGLLPAPPVGEAIDIDERVVVSPAAGVFTPLTPEGTHVQVGQRIGHVCTTSALIPVCTPFSGQLVTMTADAGERVGRCQRVAWLRTRT